MQQIKREKISDQEAKELTQFVQDVISIDYDTFEQCKDSFPWYWGKIMKFFRLPHTELHEKYMEWCRPSKELREKKEAGRILWAMDTNKEKMKNENNLMDWEAKYQIIKRHQLYHKFGWNYEMITVWIPYYDNKEKKNRFFWTINIYKSKTPLLFDSILQTIRRFTWEPDIMIN